MFRHLVNWRAFVNLCFIWNKQSFHANSTHTYTRTRTHTLHRRIVYSMNSSYHLFSAITHALFMANCVFIPYQKGLCCSKYVVFFSRTGHSISRFQSEIHFLWILFVCFALLLLSCNASSFRCLRRHHLDTLIDQCLLFIPFSSSDGRIAVYVKIGATNSDDTTSYRKCDCKPFQSARS